MFGKKKPETPEDKGIYSVHPKSKLPQPIATNKPETVTPAPVAAKPILTPREIEQLREAKFKQLKIPFAKVLEAERELNVTFDPDLVESDFLSINHRLESYNFNFRISSNDFFTCLVIIKKMAGPPINEQQVCLINSLSDGIVHTELVMNLIVWKHIEQQIRQAEKLAVTDHVPEIKIISAGKAFWQNIDRIMVWKQAEKQLRRSQGLADNSPLPKEEIEKRYQELMTLRAKREKELAEQKAQRKSNPPLSSMNI